MFYRAVVQDFIRVSPEKFDFSLKEALVQEVKEKYGGFISSSLGIVIDISTVQDVGEGVIIPGDGAPYYQTTFELLAFKPEMQEVLPGLIREIADFGAFLNLGPIDGMIHISQTMDDFVSFAKDKVLTGRDTKCSLSVGDFCIARIVSLSFKDTSNPKIGMTMRQEGLGKLEWIKEAQKKKEAAAKKAAKSEDKGKSSGKSKK